MNEQQIDVGATGPARGPSMMSRIVPVIVGTLLALGLAILLLWQSVFVRILPGEVGVLYSLLFGGTQSHKTYSEGFALKLPWDRIYILQRRLQIPSFKVLAYSKEGMPVTIEALLVFQIRQSHASKILSNIGADYLNTLVIPAAESAIRGAASQYLSHQLYTVSFDSLYNTVMESIPQSSRKEFDYYFEVSDLLVRRIVLPDQVIDAIQAKLRAEQEAATYRFRLEAEQREAERLAIQATGLRNFYSIMQDSLTDKLLTWRGIDATVQIAKSPNSKVVIVGGGRNQLPLILGSELTRADPDGTKDDKDKPEASSPSPGSFPAPFLPEAPRPTTK